MSQCGLGSCPSGATGVSAVLATQERHPKGLEGFYATCYPSPKETLRERERFLRTSRGIYPTRWLPISDWR
ncbi:hypothetical protein [Dendronalium sp. ChiSLP03b]|uniref:hypothetical protein n=1 Tax=Dendronalium sp. ChiSLP03b TaxID=3075381 RepID=UPI002AD80075|nr:hypothetical protein [Dendronalium sp. ChiSLP03b]